MWLDQFRLGRYWLSLQLYAGSTRIELGAALVKILRDGWLLSCGWIILRKNRSNHPFITRMRTREGGGGGNGPNFVIERIHNVKRGNIHTYIHTWLTYCAVCAKFGRYYALIGWANSLFFPPCAFPVFFFIPFRTSFHSLAHSFSLEVLFW